MSTSILPIAILLQCGPFAFMFKRLKIATTYLRYCLKRIFIIVSQKITNVNISATFHCQSATFIAPQRLGPLFFAKAYPKLKISQLKFTTATNCATIYKQSCIAIF